MIYVDSQMRIGGKFDDYCHMWSSTNDEEELHAFAASLGLKRGWFQNRPGFYHYDISPAKREQALELGATFKPLGEWIRERVK